MFYNHADEKERRRKREEQLQLQAREMRRKMAPDRLSSKSTASVEVGRRGSAPPSSLGTSKKSPSAASHASSMESSREIRPQLWPPSHSEIVAGLEGEKAAFRGGELANPIPGWFRGPLLLQTSGSHAPGSFFRDKALSARSKVARSRSSDEGKRKPPAIGMASGTEGWTAETGEIATVGGAVKEIAVSDDEEGEWKTTAEESCQTMYSVEEERAIRRVLGKLEEASAGDPSLVRFDEYTTKMWIERLSEPVIRELESDEAYMTSGRHPRKYFAQEAGIATLRRWVSEDARHRRNSSQFVAVSPESSKDEAGDEVGVSQSGVPATPVQAEGEGTMGEKGGKRAYGMGAASTVSSSFFGVDATIANTSPATGRAGVSSSDAFFSGEDGGDGSGAMDAFSFSASSIDDDARGRELRRGSGRWRKNVIGYPDPVEGGGGGDSDGLGVRDRSGTGRDGWDAELSSMATGSDDESSRRSLKYDDESRRNSGDDDEGSSRSSSSWNSSWNSSRWDGSAIGSNNGGDDDRFPSRFNVGPSESRLRIHSAIAGAGVIKREGKDTRPPIKREGEDTRPHIKREGEDTRPPNLGRSAGRFGAEGGGRGIREPTPPKRRRRTPAEKVASQRSDTSSASSHMITPAQAAAAEADRLNSMMQVRRPLTAERQPEADAAGVLGKTVGGNTGSAISAATKTTISTRASVDSSNIVGTGHSGGDDLGGPQPMVDDESGAEKAAADAEAEAEAEVGGGESDESGRREPMSPPSMPSPPRSSSALMAAHRAPESRADVEMGADSMVKDPHLVRERGAEAAVGSAEGLVTRKRRSRVDWPGSPRPEPSLMRRALFSLQDPSKWYFRLYLAVWLLATALLVADRLLWNLWPRQSVFSSSLGGGICDDQGCGTDYFCAMDEAPGCLADGPTSVKAFDAIARVTGRAIITTTNLILVALCHGTWNWLSEAKCLRRFLWGWKKDNARLRSIGLWTIAAAVLLHVYSALLPSVDDFEMEFPEVTGVTWPAQLTPASVDPQVDFEAEIVTWVPDDVVSVLWVSVVLVLSVVLLFWRFCCCSWDRRGGKACASAMWWLRPLAVVVVTVESFRRRSHPHVWVLNGPVLLWCAVDALCRMVCKRIDRPVTGSWIALGSDHELLLWDTPSAGKGSQLPRPPPSGRWKIGGIVEACAVDSLDGAVATAKRMTSATTTVCPTAAIFSAPLSLPLSALRSAVNPVHAQPAATTSGGTTTLTAARESTARGRTFGASATAAVSEAVAASAGEEAEAEMARKTLEDGRSGHFTLSNPHSAHLGSDRPPAVVEDPRGIVEMVRAAAARETDDRGAKKEEEEEEEDNDDETVAGALGASTGMDYAAAEGEVPEEGRTKSSAGDEMTLGTTLVAPAVGLMRKSLSEKMFRPPLASPLASPVSLSAVAGPNRRLSIHSPPLIPRGLWGTPPAGHASGDRHDSGLLGRELLPLELNGDDIFDIEVDDDDYDESSTGGSVSESELSSVAPKSSPQAGKESAGPVEVAKAAEPATLFFSREPRRRRQFVLDALAPSRIAKPFSLAEPLPYAAHRRHFSSVSAGHSTGKFLTGLDRCAGSGSNSSGSSAGNGGVPQRRFSAVALSAASFLSSAGRLESLGKARGGGGAWRLDHDRWRPSGTGKGNSSDRSGGREKIDGDPARSQESARRDKGELDSGRRNLPIGERVVIGMGAGTGPRAEVGAGSSIVSESDSSVSDDRLLRAKIRPPTPPVKRTKSIRSVSSTRSGVSASSGGGGGGSSHGNGKTRGHPGTGARDSEEATSWIWTRTKSESDRDLRQRDKEKRLKKKEEDDDEEYNKDEKEGQRSSAVAVTAGSEERSKFSATAERDVFIDPVMAETVVVVDAAAEADVVDVTVRNRRGETQTSLGTAVGISHEATRRISKAAYLSAVERLPRTRRVEASASASAAAAAAAAATSEIDLSRTPAAPAMAATLDSTQTRQRGFTREPSPTTVGGEDPEEASPVGNRESVGGKFSPSSSREFMEGSLADLREEAITAVAGEGAVTWHLGAIVRVTPRIVGGPRNRDSSWKGPIPSRMEAGTLGEDDRYGDNARARALEVRTMEANIRGPFQSAMERLAGYPELPPLLVVATGAGAGLVLEFLAFAASMEKVPVRAVTVCYSSDSPSLLRFVTNELVARKISGIRVVTALLGTSGAGRHELKRQQRAEDRYSQELLRGRLNLEGFIKRASADTEVYFCGEREFDRSLRAACARMCLAYASTIVL